MRPRRPLSGSTQQSRFTGQAVRLTASTPEGSGAVSSYQWQEWLDGSWADLGATSTSAARSVSYRVAGFEDFQGCGRIHFGDDGGVRACQRAVAGDERERLGVARVSNSRRCRDEHGYADGYSRCAVGRHLPVAGVDKRRLDEPEFHVHGADGYVFDAWNAEVQGWW